MQPQLTLMILDRRTGTTGISRIGAIGVTVTAIATVMAAGTVRENGGIVIEAGRGVGGTKIWRAM